MSKKALIVLATGYEPLEAVGTIDVLLRAQINVTLATINDDLAVTSSFQQIMLNADVRVQDVNIDEYDVVVLPGGMPGASNLQMSDAVRELLTKANEKGKYIAAICAAPIALAAANLLDGKKFTCYPSFNPQVGEYITDELVVVDSNIITAVGPVAVVQFGLKIASLLVGDGAANTIAKGMLYK